MKSDVLEVVQQVNAQLDTQTLRFGARSLPSTGINRIDRVPDGQGQNFVLMLSPAAQEADDLEQSKSAVINSLTSKSGQRTYEHAN